MKIQDTLSRTEKKIELGKIRIYLCGVTVYDESHIGHARTLIVFDVLRRYLDSKGMEIELIQNFTDVDDKIINRAKRENVRASAISSRYIQEYYDEFDVLNVKRATKYPKATEHIRDMLNLIQGLVEKKAAYVSKNGVYFSVAKFPEYGKLSKKKIDDLKSGVRIEVDKAKKDPLDFVLWKFSEDPSWDSPWGRGRPGWHIECSTMSLKYLGENFEIHGGGQDLIFPHHENEIAQSESYTLKPFVKIWMHVGMVTINGKKMSKSLGNIKSVKNLLKVWSPNVLRIFCIAGHYSKPIDYSEELLKEHETNWNKARLAYHKLIQIYKDGMIEDDIDETLSQLQAEFSEALDNNLNTHLALDVFYRIVTFCLKQEDHLTKSAVKKIIPVFDEMIDILGLTIVKVSNDEKIQIYNLLKQREEFRQQKKYECADEIRDKLNAKGIELKDEIHQTIWIKKEKH